jgi:hypothetical protein
VRGSNPGQLLTIIGITLQRETSWSVQGDVYEGLSREQTCHRRRGDFTRMPRASLAAKPGRRGPAGNPRIIDGLRVTLLYHITVPGQRGFEVRNISKFVQGQPQMLPALERVITGMKTGGEKRVELSPEQGSGPLSRE